MKPLEIGTFNIGQKAELIRKVTAKDIALFAEITGDDNPVHLDETYAAQTTFGKCIAHGIYSAGLISAVLGTKLPGPGAIYVSQKLAFRRPVFVDDTITAFAEITNIDLDRNRIHLKTGCINQFGKITAEGESELLIPKSQQT